MDRNSATSSATGTTRLRISWLLTPV